MTKPIYNPGSADAVGRGCTCDFIKNDFGRGKFDRDGVTFHCAETCQIHGALASIVSPTTEGVLFTYEYPTALKWLKSRVARPFKRRSQQWLPQNSVFENSIKARHPKVNICYCSAKTI